jgi:hypothetical protein
MRFHSPGLSRSDRRWKRRDAAHRELPTTQRAAIPLRRMRRPGPMAGLPVGRPEMACLVRCHGSTMSPHRQRHGACHSNHFGAMKLHENFPGRL